jgi:hypothetical protein
MSAGRRYAGVCTGGPWDGQHLEERHAVVIQVPIAERINPWRFDPSDLAQHVPILVGHYCFGRARYGHGVWQWTGPQGGRD